MTALIVWQVSRRPIAILANTTSTGDGFSVFVGEGDGLAAARSNPRVPGQLWERLAEEVDQ